MGSSSERGLPRSGVDGAQAKLIGSFGEALFAEDTRLYTGIAVEIDQIIDIKEIGGFDGVECFGCKGVAGRSWSAV